MNENILQWETILTLKFLICIFFQLKFIAKKLIIRISTELNIERNSKILMRYVSEFEQRYPSKMANAYMIIGMTLTNVAFIFVKLSDASIFQIIQERAILVSLFGKLTCQDSFYPKDKTGILILYSICLVLATPLYFVSIRTIPMAECIIIDQTNTIWSQFMAYYILGESMDKKRLLSLFICLCAVVLIIRPPFLFGGGDNQNQKNHTFGCLVAFLGSVLESISYTVVKLVGTQVNPIVISQYYQIVIQFLISILQFYVQFERQRDLQYFIYLFGMSISAFTFSIFLIRSMSMVSYAKLAPFSFISVFNSLIIDFCFGDVPNILSIVGGIIIIVQILQQIRE
ncbi:hypothetical protein pb186bvf_019731 [Paramecium bursaria]